MSYSASSKMSGKKEKRKEKPEFKILIYEAEYKQIQEWTKKYPDLETGGDLFGLWRDDRTAVIQLVLGPGQRCRRTAISFYQDVDYLDRVGNHLTNKEGLCHIGEWHSHHKLGLTRPSGGDENTVWSNMHRYEINRFCLLISTIDYPNTTRKGAIGDKININGYLFEIDQQSNKRYPILSSKFQRMKENSPFRESSEKEISEGAESLNQESTDRMHLPDDTVLCLMQVDFTEILRKTEVPCFKITSIDDGDVLHLTVAPHPQTNGKKEVAFRLLETFPDDTIKTDEIVETTFRRLLDSDDLQIALLISNNNQVKAFVRPSSVEPFHQIKVLSNPSKDLLYSRSKGLLESGLLEERKVAIIGLGSGGSTVAIELAKAGVGQFVLVDYDRIELNNIVRHTCGVSDLGRLKTKAIRDRIMDKNPFADVEIYNGNINDQENTRKILAGCDLIVAATDNIRSRLNINTVSLELNIPVLYGKCAVRAAGGEVVVIRPHEGPCFSCVYKNAFLDADKEEVSSFRQARENNPSYVSDSEVEATIQVGLSSDIIPISIMIVKIALVELCKGKDSALKSLENDFRNAYYMWSNRPEGQFACYPEDGFDKFNVPSILRWYSMEVKKDENCLTCSLK